jgi:hypothetical protein
MRWAGHVAFMGTMRNAYKFFVGKPEGKRQLGKPRRRWEVYVKMNVRDRGLEGVDWIHLDKDRDRWWALVNTVMNLSSHEDICYIESIIHDSH